MYSDTTAATLTYAFYHLAKDPEHLKSLRAELKPLISLDSNFSVMNVQDAGHLTGVINEALRLHPPVPSGTLRVTPKEGIDIGNEYIPGNTTVVCPNFSVGRRECPSCQILGIALSMWTD